MADTSFQLGENRQGHPDCEPTLRTENITQDNLPSVIQMGDTSGIERTLNARINPEHHWFHKLSQAVMLAFQPDTYQIAQKSLKVLETSASKIVCDRIKLSANAFKHGQSV